MTEGGGAGKHGGKRKEVSSGGFQSLGLSDPVYRGIVRMGFRMPTPVQRKSLPVVLTGIDTVCMARTGSGKTAAFIIPVLEKLIVSRASQTTTSSANQSAGAVILSPTRELSLQTLKVLQTMSKFTNLKSIGINGGESMERQFELLSSKPDIIVATPGRLGHHLSEIPDFHLKQCEIVIFDEADRLFEMGFAMQIRQICSGMPESKQTLLFSATMPKMLVEFTKTGLMSMDPAVVRLDSECSVSEELRLGFICCRSSDKDAVLLHLLRDVLPKKEELASITESKDSQKTKGRRWGKDAKNGAKSSGPIRGLTLIFAATRHHCEYLSLLLRASGLQCTQIYGTMDQEARRINLSSFRSGSTPILIVTDVAARGIDVPLIDHVVHYAFPPSAKLFIHRSGRAARAGRIGYAWGIVEPEEVAYMVDLHAFLGRKLSTGIEANDTTEPTGDDYTYTLEEMTPEMVHYGSIPETVVTEEVENVRRIMNSELTSSIDAQDIRSLVKVCDNAMKQYRRSRPEASGAGARRGRAILEGTKNVTGERQTVSIPCHPLLRGVEIGRVKSHFTDANKGDAKNVKSRLDEMKKREEFLQAMAAFRPKETIFEAFSTGGGKEVNVVSQVDKGRTVSGAKGSQTSSAGLKAMKNMRRQMKMARDKGSALIVAGSKNALVMNGDAVEVDDEVEHIVEEGKTNRTLPEPKKEEIVPSKRRLSKAERKRLKSSDGKSTADMSSDLNEAKPIKGKEKRGADFRDMAFFISDENMVEEVNQEAVTRSREIEAAMQPSSALGSKSMADRALRLESSMMDIVGDESSDMIQKQRMMRWDKSKRKYIQSTLGQELAGDSKTKRIRLESGKLIKNDKAKLGELYEKWQKKTNRSIGRTGVFDDVTTDVSTDVDISDGRAGGRGGKRTWIKNAILNSKSSKEKSEVVDVRDAGDKPMSAKQIRQERESKQNMKMKNMKKGDRKQVEKKLRGKRVAEVEEKIHKKSAYNKKKGASGQWKKGGKR